MRRNLMLSGLFSITLIISGCASKKENLEVSSASQVETEAEPLADYPIYTFEELIDGSGLIAKVAMVSETKEVKSEVTKDKHSEDGKTQEHYIPLNVTEAEVVEVIKGNEELEGQIITIKQLKGIEEPLTESSSYVAFIYYAPEEDAYYSKGIDQHLEIVDSIVQSEIKEKTGVFSVEDFTKDIEAISE